MSQEFSSAITAMPAILTTVSLCSLILIQVPPASGQAAPTATATTKSASPSWTPPHTPDGQPEIQGIYARAGIWGLALQEFESNGPHGAEDPLDDSGYNRPGAPRFFKVPTGPSSNDVKPQGESSNLVPLAAPAPAPTWRIGLVDPPDKILPWKPDEDKKRRDFLLHTNPAASLRYVEYDARCALPGLFLNGGPFEFVQPEKEVVILSEYQHYTRTIHLDGRSHLGSGIRLFMGDSIGHWEGNTLIVDTTNFNEFTGFTREIPYLSDALHTIERFTIVDENNIDYLVTIDDPKLFTKPWKTAGLYRKSKPGGYELREYACAEGTKTLENIFGKAPGQ